VESLIGEAEVSSLETRVPVPRAITFDPTVGSPSLQEFPDAVFLPVDVESLLGEAEVSAL